MGVVTLFVFKEDGNRNRYQMDESKENVITRIQSLINEKEQTIERYEQLTTIAPNDEIKDGIIKILFDEKRHLGQLQEMHENLTGKRFVSTPGKNFPKTFRQGLISAFKSELESAQNFMDLAGKVDDEFIKDLFKRVAFDEQNHALWFHFYLTFGK